MSNYDPLALVVGDTSHSSDTRLHCISADGLTAVFTQTQRKTGLIPVSRRQALREAALRQELLESAMHMGTVLPFAPGAVLHPDVVRPFVAANRSMIEGLTKRLAGLVQYQITVAWQADRVLDRFRAADELSPLFEGGPVKPDAVAAAVHQLAQRLGGDMEALLAAVTTEMMHYPLADDMVFNGVILTDANDSCALDKAVEDIDAIWTDGLKIRQVGPAPATSFALLDPIQIETKDLARAAARLKLPEKPSTADILTARRLALLEKPRDAGHIRYAAEILVAAADLEYPHAFHLCRIRADDQAAQPTGLQRVA